MNYNTYAQTEINRLKPIFEEIRNIGDMIKHNANVFDKKFYLEMQDKLSQCYDEVLSSYLKIKAINKEAEAITILAIMESHKGDSKKPTQKVIESEARVERKDIETSENVLEGWVKIVRNYIQTCRNHILAITGNENDNGENE